MREPQVISHGCRLNLAEGEAIRALLAGAGDVVVVNSCAVTAEAVATARKAIRRARRERPDARILVTGCAAEIEPKSFEGLAEVVSNAAKLASSNYTLPVAGAPQEVLLRGDPESRGPASAYGTWAPAFAGDGAGAGVARKHARAFLPVQNGCDHRCTFCVIPFGRGPSRSLPAGGVIDRVHAAVEAGVNEVVLTGVDLTAYGADLPGSPGLGQLVERILTHVPELSRLRLSSVDPCEVDDRLAALIAGEPRLMPHLHLSLQAGDDMVLKRMKRRHTRAQAVALVQRLKAARPSIAIGADLLAGFPTEDAAMFANTLALVDDCDIVFAHVFPYSPRPGTPAARMPQVSREIVRERAAALRAAGARRREQWLIGQVGSVVNVLVELDGASGHAENFATVTLPGEGRGPAAVSPGLGPGFRREGHGNRIIPLRIIAVDGDTLVGMPA